MFEQEFSAYIGAKYAIACTNGTIALELALKAIGITTGDHVIVPAKTFIATASCVAMLGAKPVVADVDPNTQCITAQTISKQITPHSRAIICVHFSGCPCDMDAIMAIASTYQLCVIEDCSQAHGAIYKEKKVGALGHISTFSYCQDKIISTGGEGGMVVTNDTSYHQKIWALRDHGKNPERVNQPNPKGQFRLIHDTFGSNYRMTAMQAAIGRIQLQSLDRWRCHRQENAGVLDAMLTQVPGVRIPIIPSYAQHAYYKYHWFWEGPLTTGDRDQVISILNQHQLFVSSGGCSQIQFEGAFSMFPDQYQKHLPQASQIQKTVVMVCVDPTIAPHLLAQKWQHLPKILGLENN